MKVRSALPQRILSVQGILCLVIILTASMPLAAVAQQAAPSSQEEAKQPSMEKELESLPLSPIEKAEKDGTAIHLSEKDIIKLALENNIDVAVDDLNELNSRVSIYGSYASYDPTLSGSTTYNSSKNPNQDKTQVAEGKQFITSKSFSYDTTFRKSLPIGGSVNATLNTSRSTDDNSNNFYASNYRASARVSYTQQLWRDLMIDSTRTTIKVRKLNLETTDSQFKRNLTTNISRIQQQYWDLISAIKNYDIQRNALKLSQKNLSDIRKKVEVGTLAPIEITQANYQVAQNRMSLITAEDTIHRQMNTLRQYISKDRNSDIWSKVIVPTDTPEFREYKIDRQTAIDTALKNRPEIEQSDIALKISDLNLKQDRNSKKWGVSLSASYGSSSSTGTVKPEFIPILEAQGVTISQGGWGRLYNDLFSGGLTNWSVGVSVDVPLWTRTEDVSIANELINRRKTVLQRNKTEQQIQVEIRNAVQAIETNRQQVETAKLNKELAQEQLDGENKRFEAGLSEFYRVLDQQNRYADAENRELTAVISYTKSIISLKESMNTLLQNDDIEIAKSASEHIPELKLFD